MWSNILAKISVVQSNAFNVQDSTKDRAIAINIDKTNIFKKALLPWYFSDYQYLYNGNNISLECIPCQTWCTGCVNGMIYLPMEKYKFGCISAAKCPDNLALRKDSNGMPYCDTP